MTKYALPLPGAPMSRSLWSENDVEWLTSPAPAIDQPASSPEAAPVKTTPGTLFAVWPTLSRKRGLKPNAGSVCRNAPEMTKAAPAFGIGAPPVVVLGAEANGVPMPTSGLSSTITSPTPAVDWPIRAPLSRVEIASVPGAWASTV